MEINAAPIMQEIRKEGFCILKQRILRQEIEKIRDYWLHIFQVYTPEERVTWSPYLGQTNTIGYSEDSFQCLYRACDFLWNTSLHEETRDLGLEANQLRNRIIGRHPDFGTRYQDKRNGVFVTVSYYPPNKGFMEEHVDGVTKENNLVHILIPLTFRGVDYQYGGMYLYDRKGKVQYLDRILESGDVVLYDGSLRHGVLRISSSTKGRLQMFPIPTYFENLEDDIASLSRVPFSRFFNSKWQGFKNKLKVKTGLPLNLR